MRNTDFQARNILSSIDLKSGSMLSTLALRYPRIIHSELMTHRVLSRNARSSRAVPVKNLLTEDIYEPHFLKNKPGMQATEEFTDDEFNEIAEAWNAFARQTQEFSKWLSDKGVHKQWANRPLEWFGYIDVQVTTDKWDNFFALRLHPAAQPEIKLLAEKMDYELKSIIEKNDFQELKPGEWHIPWINHGEKYLDLNSKLNLSVARSARISYAPFDGNASHEKEFSRSAMLRDADPIHASPFEHQAYVAELGKDYTHYNYDHQRNTYDLPYKLRSNFDFPWVQNRKLVEKELRKGK